MKIRQFSLDEEQIRKRWELSERLLKEPEMIEFMDRYACPPSFVELYAYRFEQWIHDKRSAELVSYQDLEQDISKGEYIDLYYDADTGILEEVVKVTQNALELGKEKAYLDAYLEFALPQNFQDAHFETLNEHIEDENTKYLILYDKLNRFIDNDILGYYIYGDLGVGKSYLCACVSNAFAKRGTKVIFAHVPTFLNALKQNFKTYSENMGVVEMMKRVPLLVLDDLGAELISAWARDEILLSIINERLENKRKTLITGNHLPKDLLALYQLDHRGGNDELRARRLVDRIFALCIPYQLVGENRRKSETKLQMKKV